MAWFRRRRHFEREMAEELRAHIAHRADDLEAAGVPRPEAERQARVELGTAETYKEHMRDERPMGGPRRFVEQTLRDLQFGARRLRHAPLYALFAIGSIGIGAGVTTAMFAVMQPVFWASSGIAGADDVALVGTQMQGRAQWERALSPDDFSDYQRAQTSFEALVAAAKFAQPMALPTGTQLVSGEGVTDGYFQTLGVEAAIGRVLQPADGRPDAPSVMVLSDQTWRRHFASAPEVVGQTVRFGGIPFEIVGVATRDYRGLNARMPRWTGIWITVASMSRLSTGGARTGSLASRTGLTLTVAGRLKPGASMERANAEAEVFSTGLDTSYPLTTMRWNGTSTTRGPAPRQWVVRSVEKANPGAGLRPAILLAIVALVLLVACTNLANLSIARGTSREAELAVRLALGASRARLIRELSAESMVVGAGGFVLALFISEALMTLITMDLPIFNGQNLGSDPHLSPAVVVATALAVGLALLVSGVWPAFRLSRADVRSAMAKGGAIVSPSWRTERVLIRVQTVVSVALFCGAAGFISALLALNRLDPGVDLDHMTVARTIFRAQTWDEARGQAAVTAVTSVAPDRFGLRSTAFSSSMPFGVNIDTYASVATSPSELSQRNATPMLVSTPGIFDALGVPLVTGRAFDQRDVSGSDPVIVISETSALSLFGSTEAVGREVHLRGVMNTLDETTVERRRVIGVTRDTDVGSLTNRKPGVGLIFVPLAQRYEPPNFVIGRSDSEETGDLRGLIRAGDPDVAVDAVGSGLIMLGGAWNGARIVAGIALLLGAMTLVLTMAGLFGVLSALVSRRSREIGIRKAMGANDRTIRRMILRDGARPVASGTAIGLVLGVMGGFLMRAFIRTDAPPIALVAMAIVVCTVIPATLAACYLPARRAMRVDPNVTLKDA